MGEQRLKRMPDYLERARAMATTIGSIERVSVLASPPYLNMMHLFIALGSDSAATARDRVAEETDIWLFGYVRPADLPGHFRTEAYVGEAAMEVADDELEKAFRMLVDTA